MATPQNGMDMDMTGQQGTPAGTPLFGTPVSQQEPTLQQYAVHTDRQITELRNIITQLATTVANQNTAAQAVPTTQSSQGTADTDTNDGYNGTNGTERQPHQWKAKLSAPKLYTDENRGEYQYFIAMLKAKLEIDRRCFDSESERIWYGYGRLDGRAAQIMLPWMTQFQNTASFTLEQFYGQLHLVFGDDHRQSKAHERLSRLYQNSKPFNEFLSEFDQVLLEAGGHEWDDSLKMHSLRRALNGGMKKATVGKHNETSYINYCKMLRRVADDVEELQHMKKRQNNRSAILALPSPPANQPVMAMNGPDVMDWTPSLAAVSAANQPRRRVRRVNQQEIERRKQNQLCIRCGGSGHFINACPHLPPSRVPIVANASVSMSSESAVTRDEDRFEDAREDQGNV